MNDMNDLNDLNDLAEEAKRKLQAVYKLKGQIIDLCNSQQIPIPIGIAAMIDLAIDLYVQNGVENGHCLNEIKKTIYNRFVNREDLEAIIEDVYKQLVEKDGKC